MQKVLNKIHRNIPQLMTFIVDAAITVVLFARGTGKTFGVTSMWVYLRAKRLPRSSGFICSPTYTHLKDVVVPELQNGWKNMGLEEGRHYWKYKFPPAELEIPQPYLAVDKPQYFIYWLNGSVTKLVSLDNAALVNSKSFDYGAIVEARKCKAKKVRDNLVPTLRGGKDNVINHYNKAGDIIDTSTFQEYPEHHSLLLESDLPKSVEERWILSYKKKMDQRTVTDIINLQRIKYQIKKAKRYSKKKVKAIDDAIQEMRKGLVYVGKASTLDNIHVLGVQALKNLRQSLTPRDWDISILGIEEEEVENCFYPDLSREVHGYDGLNFKMLNKKDFSLKRNWKWHSDHVWSQPLYITMDSNASHNCFNMFQWIGNQLKKVNYMYVESYPGAPTDHRTLTNNLIEYYQGSNLKKIYLVYNNTMIHGMKAGLRTKINDIEELLSAAGYTVFEEYVGQAETHENTFDNWKRLLQGKTDLKFSYNLQACDLWYDCCKDAPTKIVDTRRDGSSLKKDKSSETSNTVPPHKATHATEGADTMIQYIMEKYSGDNYAGDMAAG